MRLGGVIANRSAKTDEIDRFNAATGLQRVAHFQDLDVVRRSRLKKSTLFEMDDSPELQMVLAEYMQLAEKLWQGIDEVDASPMKDRDLFESSASTEGRQHAHRHLQPPPRTARDLLRPHRGRCLESA